MIKLIYCVVFAVFSLAICTDYTFDAKQTAVELKDALTGAYTFPACEDNICPAETTFTFDLSEMDVSYFQLFSSVDPSVRDTYSFVAIITFSDGKTKDCDGSTAVTEFTKKFTITFDVAYHEPGLRLNPHSSSLVTLTDLEDGKNWSLLAFMDIGGLDTPTSTTPSYLALGEGCKLDAGEFSMYYDDTTVTFVSYCDYTIDFQKLMKEVGSKLPGGKANWIDGSYTKFSAFDYTRADIDLGKNFKDLYYISYSVATGKYTLDTESPYLFGMTETQAKIVGTIIGVLGFIANIYCWYRCCCRKKRARPPMMSNQMMMAPGYGQPAPSFNPQQYGMQRPY